MPMPLLPQLAHFSYLCPWKHCSPPPFIPPPSQVVYHSLRPSCSPPNPRNRAPPHPLSPLALFPTPLPPPLNPPYRSPPHPFFPPTPRCATLRVRGGRPTPRYGSRWPSRKRSILESSAVQRRSAEHGSHRMWGGDVSYCFAALFLPRRSRTPDAGRGSPLGARGDLLGEGHLWGWLWKLSAAKHRKVMDSPHAAGSAVDGGG